VYIYGIIDLYVLLGLLAGYYGKWMDSIISNAVNIMLGFPFILLALATISIVGPSFKTIVIVLGVTGWPLYTRLIRAETLTIRELEYVEAARSVGCRNFRIIFRHILPNALAPVFVTASLGVASAILVEAGLSFLGFGVQPPAPSWGNILTEGRTYIFDAWWLTVFPGLAILITVLSFNLLGEGLRDALDPRLRGRR
jgi:peptide/nickel transport system permease protein